MQDLSILSKGKINPLNQMPCCSIRVEFSTGRAPWQQAKVGSCSVDKQTTGHCAEDIELWMRNFGNEHQLVIVLYDDLNLIDPHLELSSTSTSMCCLLKKLRRFSLALLLRFSYNSLPFSCFMLLLFVDPFCDCQM
ncbi:hypothetical protein LINPERPRIM_LOCUS18808 [Linum perenne]